MKRRWAAILLAVFLTAALAPAGSAEWTAAEPETVSQNGAEPETSGTDCVDEQSEYWTASGREALWSARFESDAQPLSAEEKSDFFSRYAADMELETAGDDVSGLFSVRADGSFRMEYRTSFEDETYAYIGTGTFVSVYRLSSRVYALEPGGILWEDEEDEFLVQETMLFEIPGATESDAGILKYELRNLAEENGLDPAEPSPYCFITAFSDAPVWYGKPADET